MRIFTAFIWGLAATLLYIDTSIYSAILGFFLFAYTLYVHYVFIKQSRQSNDQATIIHRLGAFTLVIDLRNKVVLCNDTQECPLFEGDQIGLKKFNNLVVEEQRGAWKKHLIEQGDFAPMDQGVDFLTRNQEAIRCKLIKWSNKNKSRLEITLITVDNKETNDSTNKALEGESFEHVAQSLPIFVATFDSEGTINFINDNYLRYSGYDATKLKKLWTDLIHPNDRASIVCEFKEAVRLNRPVTLKYRFKHHSGVYKHFVNYITPIIPIGDLESVWYSTSFDNSKAEYLKHEVEIIAAKLNGILQNMDNGFISVNRDYEVDYVNFRAELIFQLPLHPVGKNLFIINPLFAKPDLKSVLESSMDNIETATYYCEYAGASLHLRVSPTATGLSLYVQDITAELADKSELNLLRTAIDKANDVVLITTAELNAPGPKVVYVNDAFERVTGFQKSDILGSTPRILQGKETESDKLIEIKEALSKAKPIRTLIKNYTKDGTLYYNEIDISPIKNGKNETTHFVAIERDISKQKQQEDLAFRAHKMDSIGLVTGGVAHDFNNLLTIILGNCEIIEDLYEKNPGATNNQLDKITAISEAAKQGVSLTRSLLAFSKRQPLNKKTVDLNKLILSVKPLIDTALGAQVSFHMINNSTSQVISGDRAQLESMFLNMAINARDAMRGKGEFSITIEDIHVTEDNKLCDVLKPGKYILIEFSDNGSGIENEALEKIFDPFFSTKSLSKGTGLGLSMIYSYVDRSGGHISVDSTIGMGTTFCVYLPSGPSLSIGELTEHHQQPEPKKKDVDYQGKKVLIVEDTVMVAKVAIYILSSLGFEVIHAKDGHEALDMFEENKALDLLFTDIVLPNDLNGKDIAEKIRNVLPTLPVIYTSGFTDGQLQEQDYSHQNTEFLQKPYTKSSLYETLSKINFD